MSFNRENVTWQSKDGTWSLGFFVAHELGYEPDFDPEWDVEYDFDSFGSVSTGHRDQEAAYRSWHGANPGGTTFVSYEGNEDQCERYDEMARAAAEAAREAERRYQELFGGRRW